TADGAALGATSHRDFKRFAASLPALHDGGVVLNLGSAVVMPEVFLKALTVARNLSGGKPTGFTACDCDMQRHYRPRMNVVERPTLAGGRGVQLTGHHEILIPLLAWAVLRELDARSLRVGGTALDHVADLVRGAGADEPEREVENEADRGELQDP